MDDNVFTVLSPSLVAIAPCDRAPKRGRKESGNTGVQLRLVRGYEHHERRAGERASGEAADAGGSRELPDDAALHRARGELFHDEVAALAERMLGVSTNPSTRLTSPDVTSHDAMWHNNAVSA